MTSPLRHDLGPAHLAAVPAPILLVIALMFSLVLAGCGVAPMEEPAVSALTAGPSGAVRGGQQTGAASFVTEVLGIAAPVVTPKSLAVKNSAIANRP